jgi:hypothetical protein
MNEEEFQKYLDKFYADIFPKDKDSLAKMIGATLNRYDKGRANALETAIKIMMLTSNFIDNYIGKKYDIEQMDLVYMMLKKKARMGLMFFNAEDIFYPQYDNKFVNWIEELATSDQFIQEAETKLRNFPFGDKKKLHRWRLIADQKFEKERIANQEDLVEVDENGMIIDKPKEEQSEEPRIVQ